MDTCRLVSQCGFGRVREFSLVIIVPFPFSLGWLSLFLLFTFSSGSFYVTFVWLGKKFKTCELDISNVNTCGSPPDMHTCVNEREA